MRRTRVRSWSSSLVIVSVGFVAGAACSVNPTPLPPGSTSTSSSDGGSGGDDAAPVLAPLGGPCHAGDQGGTLPGVTIAIDADGCTFKTGTGGEFRYAVTVGAGADGGPTTMTIPNSQGGCGPCSSFSSDPLTWTSAVVRGNGQSYCVCDTGCCPPVDGGSVALASGVARSVLTWPGRSWGGPSDTNEPLGAAFPPGDYAVIVSTGDASGRSVTATLPIHVVP